MTRISRKGREVFVFALRSSRPLREIVFYPIEEIAPALKRAWLAFTVDVAAFA